MLQIGSVLHDARERAGLTQEQVAERLGVSTSYVGHLERGRRNPTAKTIAQFGDALGCRFILTYFGREEERLILDR